MHNCSPKINRISLVRHCLLARIAVGSTTVWMGLGPTRGLAPWCLASKALGTGDYFRINSLLRGIFCFVTECECDRSLGDWRWDTNRYRCSKVIDVSPTSMPTSVEIYSNVLNLIWRKYLNGAIRSVLFSYFRPWLWTYKRSYHF